MQNRSIGSRARVRAATDLTAVSHCPLPVYRRQEAVLGDNKLGMATVGRRQLYVKGAPPKRGTRVAQLQPQLGACVAGAVITDDVVQSNDTGRLDLSHALTPCLCLANRSNVHTRLRPEAAEQASARAELDAHSNNMLDLSLDKFASGLLLSCLFTPAMLVRGEGVR